MIKKGNLVVNGTTRCRVDCRLYIEVVDNAGKRLAEYESPTVIQASLDYQPIMVEIPVEVKRTTEVRVILHQQDVYTRQDIAVSSVLVKLLPQ